MKIISLKEIFHCFYLNRTLWVRSINTAAEECRALQTSITNDRASFSETSKIESEDFTIIFLLQ